MLQILISKKADLTSADGGAAEGGEEALKRGGLRVVVLDVLHVLIRGAAQRTREGVRQGSEYVPKSSAKLHLFCQRNLRRFHSKCNVYNMRQRRRVLTVSITINSSAPTALSPRRARNLIIESMSCSPGAVVEVAGALGPGRALEPARESQCASGQGAGRKNRPSLKCGPQSVNRRLSRSMGSILLVAAPGKLRPLIPAPLKN